MSNHRPVSGYPWHGLGRLTLAAGAALALAACGTSPSDSVRSDGPPERPSADVADVPDAVPKDEPPSRYGNPPEYEVFGETYQVMDEVEPGFEQRGYASWYGTKFHGRRTSSGEKYDMYAMTAAHRELPLPTWVEVTNEENNRSVVVKVNDRGPFVDTDRRIIDLSYAAAVRLDMADQGTAPVHLRRVLPGEEREEAPGDEIDLHQAAVEPEEDSPAEEVDDETRLAPPSDLAALRPEPLEEEPAQPGTADQSAPVEVGTAEPIITASAGISPVDLYVQVGAFAEPDNAERLRARLMEDFDTEVRVDDDERDGGTLYRVRFGPLESVTEADRIGERLEGLGLEGILVAP